MPFTSILVLVFIGFTCYLSFDCFITSDNTSNTRNSHLRLKVKFFSNSAIDYFLNFIFVQRKMIIE